MRFEHIYEKDENEMSYDVTLDLKVIIEQTWYLFNICFFFLQNIFSLFEVTSATETNLGADRDITEMKLLQKRDVETRKKTGSVLADLQVTLKPMQIRTFIAKVKWNSAKN